jgi:hypothetical protein
VEYLPFPSSSQLLLPAAVAVAVVGDGTWQSSAHFPEEEACCCSVVVEVVAVVAVASYSLD